MPDIPDQDKIKSRQEYNAGRPSYEFPASKRPVSEMTDYENLVARDRELEREKAYRKTSGAMVTAGVVLLLGALVTAIWAVNDMGRSEPNSFEDVLVGFMSTVALASALVIFAHSSRPRP